MTVSESGHNFTAGYHDHFEPVLTGSNSLNCSGINASSVPVRDYLYTVIFN